MTKQNQDGNNYTNKTVKLSHCQNKVTAFLLNSRFKSVKVNGSVMVNQLEIKIYKVQSPV